MGRRRLVLYLLIVEGGNWRSTHVYIIVIVKKKSKYDGCTQLVLVLVNSVHLSASGSPHRL